MKEENMMNIDDRIEEIQNRIDHCRQKITVLQKEIEVFTHRLITMEILKNSIMINKEN